MKDGRCAVCGAYRTRETLQKFREAIDATIAQALVTKADLKEMAFPTECCPVPEYISLREFASAYYGKVWYRNPIAPWSQRQLQVHFEEIIFISKMYHLYRFGNYTDLQRYFTDYDNGDILVADITDEVLPAYRVRAVDPDSDLGKQEIALDAIRTIEMETA